MLGAGGGIISQRAVSEVIQLEAGAPFVQYRVIDAAVFESGAGFAAPDNHDIAGPDGAVECPGFRRVVGRDRGPGISGRVIDPAVATIGGAAARCLYVIYE